MKARSLVVLALLSTMATARAEPARRTTASWDVFFSPNGGAQAAVVRELGKAKASVRVLAYSFTNVAIARALVDAHARGVDVEVILDKSNDTARYSAAMFLRHAEIATFIDAAHAIAHNKVIVIDGATVLTGSYNFTAAAEHHNAENLLVLRDPTLAGRYLDDWRVHRAHAK